MRIHSLSIKNYRSFEILEEIQLGAFSTIVGQNDVGKSNILRALKSFLENEKIEKNDVCDNANPKDNVIIEVTFAALPEKIEIEKDVETTLQSEMLVDADGNLRIQKIYPINALGKLSIKLVVHDFEDDRFSGLVSLKQDKLNELCESLEIEVSRSGRSITNKSKREALRAKARDLGIKLANRELSLSPNDDLWRQISSLLPGFELFETDTRLGVDETTFQSQFRPVIKNAVEQPNVADVKTSFTEMIQEALQYEVDRIFDRFKHHTDAFVGFTAKPEFSWEKAVSFQIFGKDQHNVDRPLDQRGSGMRRLLMVSFFQYLASRASKRDSNFIFAIEEPENCLHPGLQHELVDSFNRLTDEGYQIIITSHSPVFAGRSQIENLTLVVRESGVAKAIQYPELDLSKIAEELGVEPSDQVSNYHACVFVEGPDDIFFWKTIATTLKKADHVDSDFDDRHIGFVSYGGRDSLKHWINLRTMKRLSRRFGVIVDSDRHSKDDNIPRLKLEWKKKCEDDGGIFFILTKREIENYIHPNAITKSGLPLVSYDDYTDMKNIFGENVYKNIKEMSCDEILAMDLCNKDGIEFHELRDIVQKLLALSR